MLGEGMLIWHLFSKIPVCEFQNVYFLGSNGFVKLCTERKKRQNDTTHMTVIGKTGLTV